MKIPLLIVGLAALTSSLPAQVSVVSGVVRDETGTPVREVLVVIDPDSLSLRTRTAADGRFRITVPAGRQLEVRAVRIGFRPFTQMISVAGPTTELNIELRSIPIPLDTVAVRATRPGLNGLVITRGIALMPHAPRPLHGARIEAVNSPHATQTDKEGRFALTQLPVGAHAVMVTLDGYSTRMVPVTIPDDGGIEITVTLDSLYAEYQRWDEDQKRGISWRMHRATSPAAFVPKHEIDMEAPNLRDAIEYSYSLLSRGLKIKGGCIYVNGRPRTDLALADIDPWDVEGLEVYVPGTLQDNDRLPAFPPGTSCASLWPTTTGQLGRREPNPRALRTPATGALPPRMLARGNRLIAIVIWTRGR